MRPFAFIFVLTWSSLLQVLQQSFHTFVVVQASPVTKRANLPDLYEASIAQLQNGLQTGQFKSVDLVKAYFSRIREVNANLRAVLETNPNAIQQATSLDQERAGGRVRGPLHGIPILLKDNIATLAQEGMNTTAGSYALLGSVVPRDATVAAKLRAAGAILLGKAALSEWSNFRGNGVPSGWSGRGGQATNPYYPQADPSGSSSGSGISSAIGLAAGSLGTETDGSLISPSSKNNLVGIKPTVGLTSRAGVIPISRNQDTVGPMCRSVADAATILSVIAGRDPLDNFTAGQPLPVPDYRTALRTDALKGVRLGIPRSFLPNDPNIMASFNASVGTMQRLGAVVLSGTEFPSAAELLRAGSTTELTVLATDFKTDVNNYLAGLVKVPTGVKNLADLISYNSRNPHLELVPPYSTDQSVFNAAQSTTVNDDCRAALETNHELGRRRGIDATLKQYNLDAILLPTDGFTSTPAALAGYPIVTVPLGFQPDTLRPSPARPTIENAPGMPFGISFMGTAFSEFKLVGYAYAYEQATLNRVKRRAYPAAIPKTQLSDVMGH